jgi:branched-chain amino acid transport system permease protein
MLLQQLVNGITLGGVYALIALGYTMVYGILEFINFAHGEIFMVGAYIGLLSVGILPEGSPPFLKLLFCFAFSCSLTGILGVLVERVAYRPLRGAPRLAPLISAIGVSIFLQNVVMLVAGSENKVFPQLFPSGGVRISGVDISYIQIFIISLSFAIMIALHLFITKTRIGTAMRATAQGMEVASLMGIDVNRIISLVFLIGSILGAVAGIMVGMYYGIIKYTMGYIAGLKAFTAAVFGGIGNIPGAMVGGFAIGILESLGAGYISSDYKDAFAFLILIAVLILRPSGIMGERVSEKV